MSTDPVIESILFCDIDFILFSISAAQKIQLVRFGVLEQIDAACRCVSVQYMKENEQRFIQLANIEKLDKEVSGNTPSMIYS